MDFTVTLFEHDQTDEKNVTSDPHNSDCRLFGCDIAFSTPISDGVFFLLLNCRPFTESVELGRRSGLFGRRAKNVTPIPQGTFGTGSPTKQRVVFTSKSDRDYFIAKVSPILAKL